MLQKLLRKRNLQARLNRQKQTKQTNQKSEYTVTFLYNGLGSEHCTVI